MGAIPFDPFRCEAGCAGPVGMNTCVATSHSTGRAASLIAFGSAAVAIDRFVLTAFGAVLARAGAKTFGGCARSRTGAYDSGNEYVARPAASDELEVSASCSRSMPTSLIPAR